MGFKATREMAEVMQNTTA